MIKRSINKVRSLLINSETGATAVEYALMVALIAVVVIGAITAFGVGLSGGFGNIVSVLGALFTGNSN